MVSRPFSIRSLTILYPAWYVQHISTNISKHSSRLIDKPGLLTTSTTHSEAQKPFLKDHTPWEGKSRDLLSVIKEVHPTVLIGTSTVPGAFTEDIVKEMASHTSRPIIFPLSNPTRLHEAKPADLLHWTNGKALVATGSPFKPVTGPWGQDGKDVTVEVAECNNSVVFPGIGLGCVLSRAKLVTDKMLVAAVHGVAGMSPALDDPTEPLLPDVDRVKEVSVQVARQVIKMAVEEGVATEEGIPTEDADLEEWIKEQMWEPKYRELRLVEMKGATREALGQLGKTVGVDER